MKTIELQLDEQTFQQAQRLAESRHSTLERLLTEIISRLAVIETDTDPLLGLFANEPEVIDEILHEIMAAREAHPLRQKLNG